MKVEVIQEKLAQALVHINKAVSNKPNIPVLNNVLIETDNGAIKLSSTDLEIGINAMVGAEIAEKGKLTVSAKLLSEFVNSLKPGKLKLLLNEQKLIVESVDNRAEFFIIPADDFPSVPHSEGEPMVSLNALEFGKMLDKVTFSASTDNTRPVLTGVLTKITKRKLSLVAVDGYRLSQKVTKIEEGPKDDYLGIIPAKSLNDVNKIIKDVAVDKDVVELYTLQENNQIVFKINEVEVISRLIEGEYPAYEDILPKEKQHSFSILKGELADAVKVVSIFARNAVGNKTKFAVDPEKGRLNLSALVIDVGKNVTSVDISKTEGDEIETAYNAKFMQDMINSIKGDEIIYESNGTTSPGIFREKDDKDYIHVIMPMRLE